VRDEGVGHPAEDEDQGEAVAAHHQFRELSQKLLKVHLD
jgi:hypothetical protein